MRTRFISLSTASRLMYRQANNRQKSAVARALPGLRRFRPRFGASSLTQVRRFHSLCCAVARRRHLTRDSDSAARNRCQRSAEPPPLRLSRYQPQQQLEIWLATPQDNTSQRSWQPVLVAHLKHWLRPQPRCTTPETTPWLSPPASPPEHRPHQRLCASFESLIQLTSLAALICGLKSARFAGDVPSSAHHRCAKYCRHRPHFPAIAAQRSHIPLS